MAEKGIRLEDWIGERVTVNIVTDETGKPGKRTVGVTGFLEGVDPMGIILLFDPQDVVTSPGQVIHPQVTEPRYVFHPWPRVHLIQRMEDEQSDSP